jgi:hypothetical protein
LKTHPDFVDFVTALNNNQVAYVIVGAYALAYHGHPRATGDIDFWIRPNQENVNLLLAALKEFGFGELKITEHDVLSGKIIQLGFPPVRIDLISILDGLEADEIWASKEAGMFGNLSVWYLSKKAFIKNKRAIGRYKDLADLELLGEKIS